MIATTFDVLVVYSESIAQSAASLDKNITTPFPVRSENELYNDVYGYFLQTCRKRNMRAAFTSSADIIGPGTCKSYWVFARNRWSKIQRHGHANVVFDKVSPVNKKVQAHRELLFSAPHIRPFNDLSVLNLFLDKQMTFNKFGDNTIPTVSIKDGTMKSIHAAHSLLDKMVGAHPQKGDFSTGIVMKDRYGAGGNDIYKFKKNQHDRVRRVMKQKKDMSFILQPFTKFNKGYQHNNINVSADIRLIYLNGKIVQTYIRMAKKRSYLCNEHCGGLLKYIRTQDVPSIVMSHAKKILKTLNTSCSLFALDFIVSNNGNVYLIEGNTGPGLDWNPSIRENELKAKSFIRIIVKELARLADVRPVVYLRKVKNETPITNDSFEFPISSNAIALA